MDEMPSSEFRRRYASLTRPTIVTVIGRPIGRYEPIMTSIDARAVEAIRPGEPPMPVQPSFRRPPFSPAPKHR